MTAPRLSIVVATVMSDYPFLGRPDLHIFEPLAETLAHQDAPRGSFELIIVDSLWEQRGDWFAGKQLPFTVKHLSSFPNVWHERGRCGANSQMNRGLLHAAGDHIFWGHENCLYHPGFVTEALRLFNTGRFPIAWFLCDMEHMPQNMTYGPTPFSYSMLGYTGKRCEVEYRAQVALDHDGLEAAPWQWYYTYSGGSRELLMRLKGWDTNLDGEGYLVDCDVGSRLAMATSDSIFVMSKQLYVIEAQQNLGDWSGNVKKALPQLKCNYALLLYGRLKGLLQGGGRLGGDELLLDITREICEQRCGCRAQCKREDVIYPWVPQLRQDRFAEWQELRAASSFDVDREGVRAGRAPYDKVYVHAAT